KLSQGEYVATGNIGTVFENGSPFINQIYVYGNSARSYLLAVIVPVIELVRAELGTGPDADPAAGELRSLLRRELARVAGEAGLKSFEVPRDFIVEPEPLTHENGLLTSVH